MVMAQGSLVLTLYFISMGAALVALICGFLLFLYKKAVFQAMKLKFLSWRGYIIIDFIAKTKKSFRYCLIPREGFIEIPGRKNEKYAINEDAIVLEEGRYPRLLIVEGEAAQSISRRKMHLSLLNVQSVIKTLKHWFLNLSQSIQEYLIQQC